MVRKKRYLKFVLFERSKMAQNYDKTEEEMKRSFNGMWQKLTFKIKTSMERASDYLIHPALCISSPDLGGLLFPFQKLQMSFYFWDSVYSPSYNLIFRHQSSGNGWKQMNTSWLLYLELDLRRITPSQQDDMTVSNPRDIFQRHCR